MTTENNNENFKTEEVKVSGDVLMSKIKELIHEGNVRRIYVKNEEGNTLIEIPLTIGVVGTLIVPVFAAIGALGALVANFTLGIERQDNDVKNNATPTESVRDHIASHSDHPSEGES